MQENQLNMTVKLTEDFTLEDCTAIADSVCEAHGATVIASGFFIATKERDVTFEFDDWYARNMAGMQISEDFADKGITLIYGEEQE